MGEARSARDAAKKRRGEERAPRTRGSVAAERAVVPPSVFTMGKMQVGQRLKEVVYTLSPYEQDIMKGLFENLPGRAWYNFKKNWLYDAVPFCILRSREPTGSARAKWRRRRCTTGTRNGTA